MKKPAALFPLLALLAVACSGIPVVPGVAAVAVPPAVTDRGQTVYFGSSFPLKGDAQSPTFVYERRVAEVDGRLVSTHLTRDPAGALVFADSAVHGPDYTLLDYTLHTNQFGQTGSVHVGATEVTFQLGEQRKVEKPTLPVVVGPTLVGFIFKRLDRLRAGETLGVRFAVLDRLETLGFELVAVPSADGQTRVKMSPSSFLIGLAVDPVFFTFETEGETLTRIEGRVPPKVRVVDTWRDFDARVEYRYVAAAYR